MLTLDEVNSKYIDVLKEIGNIGAGNATTAIANMLSLRIDMAWTHSVDKDYVVRLLTIAAQFGSVTACENLAKLGRARRWSKARVERWLYFAEACRDTIEAGHAPKMELKSISDWPMSWIGY